MKVALTSPDLPRQRVALMEVPFKIGRASDVELCLYNRYVSHCHCAFDQIEGPLVVRAWAPTTTRMSTVGESANRACNPETG